MEVRVGGPSSGRQAEELCAGSVVYAHNGSVLSRQARNIRNSRHLEYRFSTFFSKMLGLKLIKRRSDIPI
jgi:hypothetical protein